MIATAAGQAEQRTYRANITRFYAYTVLLNLQLWFSIWILYLQRERGLSLTAISALDVLFWMTIVVAEVPTGAVADRWGRKASLLLGAAGFTAAILLFGIATNYWWLLASYLIWGLSMTLQSGADAAFVYESLAALGREHEYRKVMGRAHALSFTAGLIGSLAGAPFAATTSLSTSIVVSAGIAAPAVLIALTFREPRYRDAGPRPHYRELFRAAADHIRVRPALRAMVGLRAVLAGGGMATILLVQPYLAERGAPVEQFGLLTTPLRVLAIAGALTAHRLAARLGERSMFCALAVAVTSGLLLVAAVPGVAGVALFALLRFCDAALLPLSSDYINRRTPDQIRATVISMAQMATSLVLAVAEPAFGFVADRASIGAAFLTAGAACGLLSTAAVALWLRADRRERDERTEGSVAGTPNCTP